MVVVFERNSQSTEYVQSVKPGTQTAHTVIEQHGVTSLCEALQYWDSLSLCCSTLGFELYHF